MSNVQCTPYIIDTLEPTYMKINTIYICMQLSTASPITILVRTDSDYPRSQLAMDCLWIELR